MTCFFGEILNQSDLFFGDGGSIKQLFWINLSCINFSSGITNLQVNFVDQIILQRVVKFHSKQSEHSQRLIEAFDDDHPLSNEGIFYVIHEMFTDFCVMNAYDLWLDCGGQVW